MIRLVSYTTAQLASVSADNPAGVHTTRITALNTAFSGLDGSMEDMETKRAIQAGWVQAKRIFRGTTLPPELVAIHAAVVLAYGEDSPDMTECFPQGRSVFGTCLEGELDDHLGQLNTCIAARTATLGAPMVARAAALVSTWATLAGDAGDAGGDVDMTRAARQAAKTALTDQLFLMLLHLAATYPGNEAKFNEYVPEHLLEAPAVSPGPGPCTIEVTGGSGNWSGTRHSSGAELIRWFFQRVAGSTGAFTEVGNGPPEEEITFDLITAGSYEVKAHGENGDGPGPESDVITVVVT